ncbi:MAG: GNAT family N-acetyltransferase, partial [Oscillospiraceae bacterium]|nr:GNAT family N-acetyltransferase [Oscillospiraceae bacterium]
MNIRKAVLSDAKLLCEVRKLQLIDEGIEPDCDIDAELDSFFKKWLASKDFIQLIAEDNGKLLSTAAVIYYDLPPSFTNKIGVRGYVTNVYTVPEHRRKGL